MRRQFHEIKFQIKNYFVQTKFQFQIQFQLSYLENQIFKFQKKKNSNSN
jgi:hypothetical protein